MALRALVAALLGTFVALARAGIDDGLMAYWKFDGNALDSSANGNDGVIHGNVTSTRDHTGREGMALRFRQGGGEVGYISVPDSDTLHPSNQRTISLWFRDDAEDRHYAIEPMFYQGNSEEDGCFAPRELGAWFYPTEPSVQTIASGDGGCQRVLGALVPNDHRWHQMTTVIDRALSHTMAMYIDGKLAKTVPDSYSSFNRTTTGVLLAWSSEKPAKYEPFRGSLDEVRYYGRALDKQEVLELYESTQNISGNVHGFDHHGVTCENRTTGQSIDVPKNAWSWDCEAAGLIVAPGDRVTVRIHGTAM